MNKRRDYGTTIGQRVLEKSEAGDATQEARGELAARGPAISKLGDDVVYTQYQWVDPALCRPSPVNARDYQALTYDDCAELIETIKSEGKQRVAAIVRPTGDPEVPYEVVAGLRRHWAISWLRSHSYPDFKYLIHPQKLDDESAFRFSDIENRARTDISDLERGKGYRHALSAYYDSNFQTMADRIGISAKHLRRYIKLAELDPVFVDAFGGHRYIVARHGELIQVEQNKSAEHAERIIAEARRLAEAQRSRVDAGEPVVAAADILKQLVAAANNKQRGGRPAFFEVTKFENAAGATMLEFVPGNARTAATIKVLPKVLATRDEMMEAFGRIADEILARRKG